MGNPVEYDLFVAAPIDNPFWPPGETPNMIKVAFSGITMIPPWPWPDIPNILQKNYHTYQWNRNNWIGFEIDPDFDFWYTIELTISDVGNWRCIADLGRRWDLEREFWGEAIAAMVSKSANSILPIFGFTHFEDGVCRIAWYGDSEWDSVTEMAKTCGVGIGDDAKLEIIPQDADFSTYRYARKSDGTRVRVQISNTTPP